MANRRKTGARATSPQVQLKRDSVWQRPFIVQAKQSIARESEAVPEALRAAHARNKHNAFRKAPDPESQLFGALWGIVALAKSTEESDFKTAHEVYERVESALLGHNVNTTTSRIAFLHKELNASMAPHYAKIGAVARAAWLFRISQDDSVNSDDIQIYQSGLADALEVSGMQGVLHTALSLPTEAGVDQIALHRVRLDRLGGRTERAKDDIEKLRLRYNTAAVLWEEACLTAQSEGNCRAIAAVLRKKRELRTPRNKLVLYLWSHAQSSKEWQKQAIKPTSLRRSASSDISRNLLRCATTIEKCYTTTLNLEGRIKGLEASINDFGKIEDIECQLLLWVAASRWLRRIKRPRLATFALQQYSALSLAVSNETDILGLVSTSDVTQWTPGEVGLSIAPPPPTGLKRRFVLGQMLAKLCLSMSRSRNNSEEDLNAYAKILAPYMSRMRGPIMKFGQLLSSYGLELPEEARLELSELRDSVPTISGPAIRQIVEQQTGMSIDDLFLDFQDNPIAAGSIGQVHAATLPCGTEVAVKIQYPGIRKTVESDMRALRMMKPVLRRVFPTWDIEGHIKELETLFLEECDYTKEAENQTHFYEIYRDDPEIHIPRVFQEISTKTMLVTERAYGMDLETFKSTATQEQRDLAGRAVFRFVAGSIFGHSAFNTDLHPGNFLFRDGSVTFLDFGSTRYWEKNDWGWSGIVRSFVESDRELFKESFLALGIVKKEDEFDFDWARNLLGERLLSVLLTDEKSQFDAGSLTEDMELLVLSHPEAKKLRIPPRYLYGFRAYYGMFATLIALGSKAHWRALAKNASSQSPTDRKPPKLRLA